MTDFSDAPHRAWLAGLIDGEGSIGIADAKTHPSVFLSAQMTCHASILTAHKIMTALGADSAVTGEVVRQRQPEQHSGCFHVRVCRMQEVKAICEAILPYAVTKRAQCELMIAYADKRLDVSTVAKDGKTHSTVPIRQDERELIDRICELNQKGPNPSPFPDEPLSRIIWLDAEMLSGNLYNPNIVFNQELQLLELSLLKSGWVQPLLVQEKGLWVIDGFHRWMLSKQSERLKKRYGGLVPCAMMDIPKHEAMMLTIRINRAKGTHVAVRMSDIVRELIDKHACDRQEIAHGIGANLDEVDLLYQASIFEAKGMKEYRYSQAWVPDERQER